AANREECSETLCPPTLLQPSATVGGRQGFHARTTPAGAASRPGPTRGNRFSRGQASPVASGLSSPLTTAYKHLVWKLRASSMKVKTLADTPTRRTQAERTAATKALLIDSARKLFADKGFSAVSTEAIVAEA